MQPFLKQVAAHYFGAPAMSRCFIFPNRRSLLFFRKYFAETVAACSDKPVLLPAMLTINDFFYRLSGAAPADRVRLLLELYGCYKGLHPHPEELDDFIFWGDVLLGDFDDVDKYMADPARLFTNVADFKRMQAPLDYFTPAQLEAVRRFMEHFQQGDMSLRADEKPIKQRFLSVWEILLPLYRMFRERLRGQGIAYEGMVYREIAERLQQEPASELLAARFPGVQQFVFVGLNALNACEHTLLKRMQMAGLAAFCWDYASPMIQDAANQSSVFMRRNIQDFPPAFRTDTQEPLPETVFHVVSVPSGVGMAKQLPAILGEEAGMDTAIVLSDERLLMATLHSIPAGIRDLNVTMGYPMRASSLWSLMNDVATLQLHLRNKKGAWFFYHKQVQALASNAVFRSVLTPEEKTVLQAVSEKKAYYLACDSLGGSDLLEAVFRPVVTEPAGKDAGKIADICRYQLHLVTVLAGRLKEHGDMAVELDFARAFYESVSRLEQYGLAILPQTYFRLLTQLVGTATVPFTGEPLKGLQIMGPLETRALDFDKLVILGCNEGSFPRRSVSTSFIPPELRRGFDLPAYEYKDAVWAYYFYRMIQRASEVWMVCDTRTEGVNTGEPSRYIRQLELHFKKHIIRHVPQVSLCPPVLLPEPEKTQEQIDALRRGHLSASALNAYFDCPAKFYYGKVCGLKEDQDVVAYLDAGMFGTVFHAVMQKLYQARLVDAACLQRHLQDEAGIRDMVRREIFEQLSTDELSGRNILYADVIVQYVRQALRRDWELLEKTKAPHFEVLGVELRREVAVDGYTFVGYIDRLDSLEAGKIRVVDYKTGRVEAADLEYAGKRFPHIGMQLYLYRRMLEKDPVFAGKAMEFSVYQTARLFVEGVEVFVPSPAAEDWMAEQLHGALAEISDVSLPWKRTAEPETCQYCPFKLICGK